MKKFIVQLNKLASIQSKFNLTSKQVKIANDLGNICTYNTNIIDNKNMVINNKLILNIS